MARDSTIKDNIDNTTRRCVPVAMVAGSPPILAHPLRDDGSRIHMSMLCEHMHHTEGADCS